jgi:hypothetical protein
MVFNGRECTVVYQNLASREFHQRNVVGERAIRRKSGDWSLEDVRDRVWRGESFVIKTGICLYGRQMLVDWSYEPIRDAKDRVVGFLSEGIARHFTDPQLVADLATWLESGPLIVEQPSGLPLPQTCLESLSDSRRQLARSLRQSLSPVRAH